MISPPCITKRRFPSGQGGCVDLDKTTRSNRLNSMQSCVWWRDESKGKKQFPPVAILSPFWIKGFEGFHFRCEDKPLIIDTIIEGFNPRGVPYQKQAIRALV